MPRHWKYCLLLFGLLFLVGCSPSSNRSLVAGGQTAITDFILLEQDRSVGQSFVAAYDGLSGVQVYLRPLEPDEGSLSLSLRPDPTESEILGVARLPLAEIKAPGYFRFDFPALDRSRSEYAYAVLEVDGPGSLEVGMGPGGAYLDGALHQNDQPIDAQMAFALVYDTWRLALGLGREFTAWIGVLGLGLLLYILPGWALLDSLWPAWKDHSPLEKAALSAGASLALYPLLILWTNLIGLQLGSWYAWGTILLSLTILIIRHRGMLRRKNMRLTARLAIRRWFHSTAWFSLLCTVVLVLMVFTRFWAVRSLDAPMWGDAYHHTLITQLIMDNGGLFDSWEPYVDLESMTYHFGFHAGAATLHWMSGRDAPRVVLWSGQLFNLLAVLALYPLAARLGGRWAGLGALIIAGLLLPMPMSYTNWGRYTQLAGQVILPAAVLVMMELLRARRRSWGTLAVGWILFAGLALTHYRILIFALLSLPVFYLVDFRRETAWLRFKRIAWLGMGAFLLFLPWFIHVYGGLIMQALIYQVTTPPAAQTSFAREYNAIGDLTAYLPVWTWLLMGLAFIWGVIKRNREALFIGLWWLLLLLMANPDRLGLPGAGVLSNFALFIAAYIPAGVLLGAGLGWLLMNERSRRLLQQALGGGALVVCLGIISLWGASQRLDEIKPDQFALVTRPDGRAASWINSQTAEDSRFLVNFFFAYGNSVVVGSDGGWWLPLLAVRKNTLPPLTYGVESSGTALDRLQINALMQEIQSSGLTDPQVAVELSQRGVTHVYLGQRQGSVNNPGQPVFDPQQLQASPLYRLIYHRDRVWVFELQP